MKPLIKLELANRLREHIVSGVLSPGMRIVEATWGRRLDVAQGSIREAINLLMQEGFVTKSSGRSARVISLSEEDVLNIYELRGAIEGLAARLAAERGCDTGKLEEAIEKMRKAAMLDRCSELLDADLSFHLELCSLSRNPYLIEQARRVLLPFFAFVRIRAITMGQDTSAWTKDLGAHQRIVDLLREGEGDVVEHYVSRAMSHFAETAYNNWRKELPVLKRSIKSKNRKGSHDTFRDKK